MGFEFKDMQKWGKSVGREGMSKEAVSAVEAFDGSYVGAMILAGKMKAIAQAAGCDGYWSEKVNKGYQQQLFKAERHNLKKPEQNEQGVNSESVTSVCDQT